MAGRVWAVALVLALAAWCGPAVAQGGKGIGAGLLLDAAIRAFRSEIAAFAVVVAKDDAAIACYRHLGFIPFATAPMSLNLPLAEFARSIALKPRGGAR